MKTKILYLFGSLFLAFSIVGCISLGDKVVEHPDYLVTTIKENGIFVSVEQYLELNEDNKIPFQKNPLAGKYYIPPKFLTIDTADGTVYLNRNGE